MPITVMVPGPLRDCTAGHSRFALEAGTLAEAIQAMLGAYPLLRVHLFDEQGRIRRHVLLFYNDESVARLPSLDVPLREGDTLSVVQNVSGGRF